MDVRRRQFVATGAGLMMASSWGAPVIARNAAPLLAVIDLDTPGARSAYKTFVAVIERRFASARVTPQLRFIAAESELNDKNTQALGDALRPVGANIVLAFNTGFAMMLLRLGIRTPILFFSLTDPVSAGLTDSLTRPNKGMTGFTLGAASTLKRREMLVRLAPRCRIMGLLSSTAYFGEGQRRADSPVVFPGIEIRKFNCDSSEQLSALLKSAPARAVDAWDIEYAPFPFRYPEETVRLFDTLRRPVMYPRMKHVQLGGMAAYEPKIEEADDALVSQVASLLAGVPIENIPIVQATRYSFGLNLKACRRVGIEPPKSLVKIADVVLE